jgi:hypothetical protein
MKISPTFSSRTLLLTAAVLLIVAALVVAIAVIPQVQAEVLRGGTPQQAVTGFWINIIVSALVAAIIWLVAIRTKNRKFFPMFILGVMGLIILVLGWALSDAAGAYITHGPAMYTASIILFVCAGVDFLALLLVIVAALFFPKKHETV